MTEVKRVVTRGQSCIVGKLVSERMVSKETIKTTLMRWWRLTGTFTFKIMGGNLFLIEFELARNKARVLVGRPWVFEDNLFLVEDFDGRTSLGVSIGSVGVSMSIFVYQFIKVD
jgi:hypothetical protein